MPRQEQLTFTIYQFDELETSIKNKIVRDNYNINVGDDWYDYIHEDAIAIGELMGINIDRIYFSGFCSQGDGACFEGTYEYANGSVKAVKEYAPEDEQLHDIVQTLFEAQRKSFYQIGVSIKHSGHYYHEYCTDCTTNDIAPVQYEKDVIEALRAFMRWIYKRLEEEDDRLTSDEQIAETLSQSDNEYLEDGTPYLFTGKELTGQMEFPFVSSL